jgi:hypothetical protein
MRTPRAPIGSGFGAATTAAEVIRRRDLTGKVAIVTGGWSFDRAAPHGQPLEEAPHVGTLRVHSPSFHGSRSGKPCRWHDRFAQFAKEARRHD